MSDESTPLSAEETQNYWRGLLARYMWHVVRQEGIDFTDRLSDEDFTPVEQAVLRDISEENGS